MSTSPLPSALRDALTLPRWLALALLAAISYLISLPMLWRAQGLWDRNGLLDVTFPIILMVLLLLEPRFSRLAVSGGQQS